MAFIRQIFRIFAHFLSALLAIGVYFIGDLASGFSESPVLVYAICCFISFAISCEIFFAIINTRKKKLFLAYLGTWVFLTLGAFVFNQQFNSHERIEDFTSYTGNCGQASGFILKSSLARFVIRFAMQVLPPEWGYAYFVSEDVCRAKKLEKIFSTNESVLCSQLQKRNIIECYEAAIQTIGQQAPMMSTGATLSLFLGVFAVKRFYTEKAGSVAEDSFSYLMALGNVALTNLELLKKAATPDKLMPRVLPEYVNLVPKELSELIGTEKKLNASSLITRARELIGYPRNVRAGAILLFEKHVREEILKQGLTKTAQLIDTIQSKFLQARTPSSNKAIDNLTIYERQYNELKARFNRNFAFEIVARQPRCKPVGQAQGFSSEVYPLRYIEREKARARPNGAADRLPQ